MKSFSSPGLVSIDSVLFQNCHPSFGSGGALLIVGQNLTSVKIKRSSFENCRASLGGAMDIQCKEIEIESICGYNCSALRTVFANICCNGKHIQNHTTIVKAHTTSEETATYEQSHFANSFFLGKVGLYNMNTSNNRIIGRGSAFTLRWPSTAKVLYGSHCNHSYRGVLCLEDPPKSNTIEFLAFMHNSVQESGVIEFHGATWKVLRCIFWDNKGVNYGRHKHVSEFGTSTSSMILEGCLLDVIPKDSRRVYRSCEKIIEKPTLIEYQSYHTGACRY